MGEEPGHDPSGRDDTSGGPLTRLRSRIRTSWHRILLCALPVAVFVWVGWARRWAADDAFINYRVIKQIRAGNGPVYNIGQRVEATTSALWAFILLIADLVSPLRLEWNAIVVELGLGALGMVAGMAGALRLARLRNEKSSTGVVLPLGALTYLAVAGTWDWATGGLENGLSIAWIGGAFWAVAALVDVEGVDDPSRRRLLATAFLVGLGVLVRPDFAVFCAAFAVPVGLVAWRRRRWRSLVAAGAAAAALPLVVQILRMGYYGQLFPNTLYAKEGSRSWWSQGWHYLTNFASPYALVIPVVVTLLWLGLSWRQSEPSPRTRSWRVVVVSTELAALGHTIAVVRAGGDYMHARLLLPGWFALLLPLFAVPLRDLRLPSRAPGARLAPSLRLAGFATLLVWGIAAAALWRPPPGTLFGAELSSSKGSIDLGDVRIVDGRQMTVGTTGAEHRILVEDTHTELRSVAEALQGRILVPGYYEGLWRGAAPLPGSPEVGRAVIPVGAAGADGFATPLDVWVYDTLGLGDAIVARLQLDHRGTPGHEKMLSAAWVAAMYVDPNVYLDPEKFAPSGVLLQNVAGVNLPGQLDEEEFEADRAAATKALHCGDLRELIERTREPLTPGRFFGNLVGAVGLDSFRFDIDPQVAEKALCD